MNNMYIWIW